MGQPIARQLRIASYLNDDVYPRTPGQHGQHNPQRHTAACTAAPTTADTRDTVPHRANPTQTAYAHPRKRPRPKVGAAPPVSPPHPYPSLIFPPPHWYLACLVTPSVPPHGYLSPVPLTPPPAVYPTQAEAAGAAAAAAGGEDSDVASELAESRCQSVCVCVCIYIYIYIYLCLYLYLHIYMCVCVCVCVCVYVYIYMCVCVCVCIGLTRSG